MASEAPKAPDAPSGGAAAAAPPERTERARVVWDEANLQSNAEWHAAHPVTMRIDEPKTPYNYDDGEYSDDDDGKEGTGKHEGDGHSSWSDAHYNHLAVQARHAAAGAAAAPVGVGARGGDVPSASVTAVAGEEAGGGAPPRKRAGVALPALATAPVDETAARERDEAEKTQEFKHMRKAVYADEGAKFRALLAKTAADDEDEDDEDKDDADDADA